MTEKTSKNEVTAEVAKIVRYQRCEHCDDVVEQNKLRPVLNRDVFPYHTELMCPDCEKAA